jgi:hypothetical protein
MLPGDWWMILVVPAVGLAFWAFILWVGYLIFMHVARSLIDYARRPKD